MINGGEQRQMRSVSQWGWYQFISLMCLHGVLPLKDTDYWTPCLRERCVRRIHKTSRDGNSFFSSFMDYGCFRTNEESNSDVYKLMDSDSYTCNCNTFYFRFKQFDRRQFKEWVRDQNIQTISLSLWSYMNIEISL